MPNHIRVSAICCGLLALLLQLGERFWVQPWSWRFEPWPVAFMLHFTAGVGALLLPLAIFGLVAWRRKGRGPASLTVDTTRKRFVASAAPYLNGMWTVLLMWLAAGFVITERVPNQEAMRVAELPGALVVSIVTVLVFVAGGVALLFYDTARVVMDPEDLYTRRLWRSSRVAWDDIASMQPVKQAIYLYRRSSPSHRIVVPLGYLHVEPQFLTAAITTYVQQPERRAAIGTVEELQRLLPPEPITKASARA